MVAKFQSEVQERLRTASRVSLFTDFDGTLVAISDDPASPRLDPATTETLRLLASLDSIVPTIISGRSIADLYTRVGLKGLIYAGNHGMEICGTNLRFL